MTISWTGDFQPRRTLPETASATFMPRLGTTVIFMAPVSMVTSMTPSWRPPCSSCTLMEKGEAALMPSCLLVIVCSLAGVLVSSSVVSHALAEPEARAAAIPRAIAEVLIGFSFIIGQEMHLPGKGREEGGGAMFTLPTPVRGGPGGDPGTPPARWQM